MTNKKAVTGQISANGKFTADWPDLFLQAFKHFAGQQVEIYISKLPKRSNPLNRYYWGVVLPLLASALTDLQGEAITTEDAHEFCKAKFNAHTIAGERVGKSTTSLSNEDFLAYLEAIKGFAAQYLNIYIPDPNEPPIPSEEKYF